MVIMMRNSLKSMMQIFPAILEIDYKWNGKLLLEGTDKIYGI